MTQLLNGIAPLSHLGVIRVEGEDAAKFLHGQLTQDFALLDMQHARLAAVRIVEIDTATHSGVSYVVRPARYTTAGTVMVDAPPREYEVTFDGMGFVR